MKPFRVLLLSLTLASPLAQAQIAQMPPHMARGMMDTVGPRMMMDAEDMCPMTGGPYLHAYPWRMNLTDAQRAQAEQIFEKARTRLRANRDVMLTAQNRLRDALNKPKRDRAEIMNAYREVEQLRARQFEANLDAQIEFEQMLAK